MRCGGVFDLDVVTQRSGFIEFSVRGRGAAAAFASESGGHRVQRVPPTEKRGRVHTSTITVAVLDPSVRTPVQPTFDEADCTLERYKGGKGGQHQNKHANNVRLTHRPSGATVQVEGRHFHKNRDKAYKLLMAKLQAAAREAARAAQSAHVAAQVGTGMRGDKVMTAALQRDTVVHHVTGKTTTAKRYLRGHVDDLH